MTAAPVALMSCMQSERIPLREWLARHRAIGLGPIRLCTAVRTDGPDRLPPRLPPDASSPQPGLARRKPA